MSEKIDRDHPASFNDPGRKVLEEADTSQLGMALMTITNELWVLSDRVRVLEAVLESKGMDVHREIENFQPDESLQKELDEKGQALVARVLAALTTSK